MTSTPIRSASFGDPEETSNIFFVDNEPSTSPCRSQKVRINTRPGYALVEFATNRLLGDSAGLLHATMPIGCTSLRESQLEEPSVGSLIADRYRVVRLLGEGGMGKVYEVRHKHLPRTFAIKVLKPNVARMEGMQQSFLLEAKHASSLQHPNMVAVLDFGNDRRFGAYILMECVNGRLLSHYIRDRDRVTIKRSCDVALQVAEAIAYIHERNIIHCDIKPQNVMLSRTPDGDNRRFGVKILDFGLAQKFLAKREHAVFGTPEYLAPELLQSGTPTVRSDIYSMGILLFELLVGRPPWVGLINEVLAGQAYQTAPPLSEARGKPVPQELQDLVSQALSKRPEDRQESMLELVQQLRKAMHKLGMVRRQTMPLVESEKVLAAANTFAAVNLPMGAIASDGRIIAANHALAALLETDRISLESSSLRDTEIGKNWAKLSKDLRAVSKGDPVGRIVEFVVGERTVRVRVWLESTIDKNVLSLCVYPSYS